MDEKTISPNAITAMFAEGLSRARAPLEHVPSSRERSLAETKLDEAELWLFRYWHKTGCVTAEIKAPL